MTFLQSPTKSAGNVKAKMPTRGAKYIKDGCSKGCASFGPRMRNNQKLHNNYKYRHGYVST